MARKKVGRQSILGLSNRYWLIILLIITLAAYLVLRWPSQDHWGTDSLFHYEVIEGSLERGQLQSFHPKTNCFEGQYGIHPLGFYAIPYFLAPIFGLQTAFYLTPVLLGLISLFFAFLLFRRLFSQATAIIVIMLLTVSYSFINRSFAGSYRGDALILPFLLASLYFGIRFLEEKKFGKKLLFAAISGGISGYSAVMWNGYPLVIFIVLATYAFYLVYGYARKEKIKDNANAAGIAALSQGLFLVLARLSTPFFAKGLNFYQNYYLIYALIPFLCLTAYLYLTEARKNRLPMLIPPAVLLVLFALLKKDAVNVLLGGFGAIEQGSIPLLELSLRFDNIWNGYYYLLTLAFIGLFVYIRRLKDLKYVYYLGFILPMAFILFTAKRFIFLGAFFVLLFTGMYLEQFLKNKTNPVFKWYTYLLALYLVYYMSWTIWYYLVPMVVLFIIGLLTFKWKKHLKHYAVITIILLGTAIHAVYFATSSEDFDVDPPVLQSYAWIKENTPEDSCFIGTQNNIQQLVYYSDRYTYLPSLGGLEGKRYQSIMDYFLTNKTLNPQFENVYVIVSIKDLFMLPHAQTIRGIVPNGTISYLLGNEFIIDANFSGWGMKDQEDNLSYEVREYETEDNITYYRAFWITDQGEVPLRRVITRHGDFIDREAHPGCILSDNTLAFLSEEYCDSNLVHLIAGQPMPSMDLVYEKGGVNIYKLTPDS